MTTPEVLRERGWTEREIGLLLAYEYKIQDFARETLRASKYYDALQAIKEDIKKWHLTGADMAGTANRILHRIEDL